MSPQKSKSHYEVLGVSRKASDDDIRSAYRDLAMKLHPDKNPGDAKKAEDFLAATQAYETLSDQNKRKTYDEILYASSQEGSRIRQNGNGYLDLNNLFNFGSDTFFSGQPTYKQPQSTESEVKQKEPEIKSVYLSNNDAGLFSALSKAYRSISDGKWQVNKSRDDKREFVPQVVYEVLKEDGDVFVYKTIQDWKDKYDRGKQVMVAREGRLFDYNSDLTLSENVLIGEDYLTMPTASRIRVSSLVVPRMFGDFLKSIKSMAKKLPDIQELYSDWPLLVQDEMKTINDYYQHDVKGSLREDSHYPEHYKDERETVTVHKVGIRDFWKKVRESESQVVKLEGQNNSPEGRKFNHGEKNI